MLIEIIIGMSGCTGVHYGAHIRKGEIHDLSGVRIYQR